MHKPLRTLGMPAWLIFPRRRPPSLVRCALPHPGAAPCRCCVLTMYIGGNGHGEQSAPKLAHSRRFQRAALLLNWRSFLRRRGGGRGRTATECMCMDPDTVHPALTRCFVYVVTDGSRPSSKHVLTFRFRRATPTPPLCGVSVSRWSSAESVQWRGCCDHAQA